MVMGGRNPDVLYFNNDDSKQPGSKGLASGQQEMSATDRLRAQFEAAVICRDDW